MYMLLEICKWRVELYRTWYHSKVLQFNINLPFIHINNILLAKQAFDGHGGFMNIPVVSGKVFWWKI